jgi:competence protein ComEC
MAVVAGLIFFVVRALFALIPGLADRAPIKKWVAFAALMVTDFYLVPSTLFFPAIRWRRSAPSL